MKFKYLIIILIFIGFTNFLYAEEIVIAGSTTFQKRILEPTADLIQSKTGIKIQVLGINTGKGFEELRNGKNSASIASSPLVLILAEANLPDDGTYKEHIIIKDIIIPIVNANNPIKALSWEQLTAINTGKISNWKEIGGEDQPIIVVTSQPTAATRVVFQDIVMRKAPYVKTAREVRSTREEINYVSKLKGGIGAVSEGFLKITTEQVKPVKTEEISRPLSIITKGDPSPAVQKIINVLKTPEAIKLFK
ncbi:MAG: substrate-binding domain-containing protein [Desulfobacterales bacterium]|nr:substrate-binding domain-containing protein [Desulfobacterales bacterium]